MINMSKLVLEAKNLYKNYSGHRAVEDFSLSLSKGQIYALLGQNGAGKSSILRMLSGIFLPDKGSIEIHAGEKIGYLPEERGLYQSMKVKDHLEYLTELKGLKGKEVTKKILNYLERFGLIDWKDKEVKQLSKGMQQKVQILATTIHEPELLILDEPFSGLDPVSLEAICELINELKEQGTAIIICTHQFKTAESISDNFCFLHKGKTVWQGTCDELKNYFGSNLFHFEIKNTAFEEIQLQKNLKDTVESIKEISSGNFEFKLKSDDNSQELIQFLFNNFNVSKFERYEPTLSEVFERATNTSQ